MKARLRRDSLHAPDRLHFASAARRAEAQKAKTGGPGGTSPNSVDQWLRLSSAVSTPHGISRAYNPHCLAIRQCVAGDNKRSQLHAMIHEAQRLLAKLHALADQIEPPFAEFEDLIAAIVALADALEGDTDIEGGDEREPDDEATLVAPQDLDQSPVELRRGKPISKEEQE